MSKQDKASALWKQHQTATSQEFLALYKKKHGEEISEALAAMAKKKAGLVKARKKGKGKRSTSQPQSPDSVLASLSNTRSVVDNAHAFIAKAEKLKLIVAELEETLKS